MWINRDSKAEEMKLIQLQIPTASGVIHNDEDFSKAGRRNQKKETKKRKMLIVIEEVLERLGNNYWKETVRKTKSWRKKSN